MQGKKQYEERLFVSFQLSDHVPKDNFYRRLKNPALFTIATKIIIVAWAMKQLTKDIYQRMHQRMQTKRARRLMKERSSTVEPVIGTLVNYLGMKKVNIKGLQQANKCMLLSATAYNIKKLLKHTPLLVQTKTAEMKKIFESFLKKIFNSLKGLCQSYGRYTTLQHCKKLFC